VTGTHDAPECKSQQQVSGLTSDYTVVGIIKAQKADSSMHLQADKLSCRIETRWQANQTGKIGQSVDLTPKGCREQQPGEGQIHKTLGDVRPPPKIGPSLLLSDYDKPGIRRIRVRAIRYIGASREAVWTLYSST